MNPATPLKILVAEDEDLQRIALLSLINKAHLVFTASTKEEAINVLKTNQIDLAFLDLDLKGYLDGLDLIGLGKNKETYFVVLSGHEQDEIIEKAYRLGCRDYLCKPASREAVDLVLSRYQAKNGQDLIKDFFNTKFITKDGKTIQSLSFLHEGLNQNLPIFISGPTGVGKTLVAKLIFDLTHQKTGQFIHLNCSELSENILESELFGHVKGAFTGAQHDKKGKLELANGGVLFLDEVATMPMVLQKKILRVIEEKVFYPLGSEKLVRSNFLLITATCENLNRMVKKKKFRSDLYFRLQGHSIYLSPLTERKEDISLQLKYFLKMNKRKIYLEEEVVKRLADYHWPGNTRELKKIIDIFCENASGRIQKKDLPEYILKNTGPLDSNHTEEKRLDRIDSFSWGQIQKIGLKNYINSIEREILERTFANNDGKLRATLRELKISNSAFYRIMGMR